MKKFIAYIVLLISGFSFAQIKQGEVNVNRNEDFEQGTVTVERVYEPKVEAAEKIKQTPNVAIDSLSKLPVNYGLKDVEAASDFETSVLAADELPVEDGNLYKNYIRAGYGSKVTLLIDGYGEYQLDDTKTVGASVDYRSTEGKIPDYTTKTDETKAALEGFLKLNFEESQADVRLGGSLHNVNFYGISDDNLAAFEGTDVAQRFTNIYASGKYTAFNHFLFKDASVKANFFGDKFSSSESAFDLETHLGYDNALEFSGFDLGALAGINLNFSNTKFSELFESKFTNFNIGVSPQLQTQNDFFQAKAGINLQYLSESFTDKSEFYIFPKAEVYISAVPEFGFYGGITGGIQQNRYQSLTDINPFLMPNQFLQSTINKMEFYAGIKGDIGANFKYDAVARYQNLENIPFFIKYQYFGTEPYSHANTFSTIYDDGKRTAIEGTINYLGVSNLNLGANLQLQNYNLDTFDEAWYKPMIRAAINADYKFLDDRLILSGELFFVDKQKATSYAITALPENFNTIHTLDSYLDLNLNATYLILDRWAAFVEINNALNKNYDRFLDYPVQGFVVVGGVMFKF